MSAVSDHTKTQAVADIDELLAYFTNKGVKPKVFHGMGTMLGFHPWLGDRIYWFNWDEADAGFRHAITNRSYPDDIEFLDLSAGEDDVVDESLEDDEEGEYADDS